MKSLLLDKIFDHYLENPDEFLNQRNVFVLPSRRSIVYSKHYLKNLLKQKNKSSFFPELLTINDWLEHLTGLIVLPKTQLIYQLYISYKKNFSENPDPFSSFLKWGQMLLNDFNDLLITHPNNPEIQKQIYTNLTNIKEIEHWSLNREPLSANQRRYLDLMGTFYNIFQDFNASILQQGYAYSGLLYEEAVKRIQSRPIQDIPFLNSVHQFIFVGLNAITPAEKIILDTLKKENKARFYWDYDNYYVFENKNHEAGEFIRKNFTEFGIEEINKQSESYFDKPKNIEIVAGTNDIEEALYIKKVLEESIRENPSLDNTAILLNKPEALNLVLSAIPDEVEYNISMEYPISYTPAFQFLNQLLKILTDQEIKNKKIIYHRYFTGLLQNPFFKSYLWNKHQIKEYSINTIIQNVHQKNKIYIALEQDIIFNDSDYNNDTQTTALQIQKTLESLLTITNFNLSPIIQFLESYLYFLQEKKIKDVITINTLQSICQHLNTIHQIILNDKENVFESIKDVQVFIHQSLSRESLAFKGEPLKGLQILGMLESRLLDFENLIIPFMNEGVFPPNHQKHSFFPFDLRNHYKLPTHYNDDAIFSYTFYRNLHSPSKIFLSYNHSDNDDNIGLYLIKGEQSRYIQQIIYELSLKKDCIKINQKTIVNSPPNLQYTKEITIPKDNIKTLLDLVYSPTSITNYLDCSLRFYFSYILKLKEVEEATEEIQANIEGNIFHQVMQDIFSNKEYYNDEGYLDAKKIEKIIHNPILIANIIKTEIDQLHLEHKGKILIQEELLKEEILEFLKKEQTFIKNNLVKIIYTEKEKNTNNKTICSLFLPDGNSIKIYGIPDRIDLINNGYFRVVDYKTSYKKSDNLEFITDIHQKGQNENINKQIQLQIYVWYALNTGLIPSNEIPVTAAILPLRDRSSNKTDYQKYITQSNEVKKFTDAKEITQLLQYIFTEHILNTEKPFQQTEDTRHCAYCSFNYICKR
ncbi:MAG: hypothetical protein KatS3mg027_0643 [Bacteroidia bacterium]|nr:MAG: hypothetical protein KatS3mg027_0643 [Bacteroidia bacterium]